MISLSKLSVGKLLLVQSNIAVTMGIFPVQSVMCDNQYAACMASCDKMCDALCISCMPLRCMNYFSIRSDLKFD